MKRLLIIGLVIILTSCSKAQTQIPLIIYDYNDLYMQDFQSLIINGNTYHYNFVSYNSKNSQVIQNEIIEDAFKEDYPLLIVNPVDRLGVYPIIEKAKEMDTPIIFINREPLQQDLELFDDVYYVGAQAVQSAELQAEIVMELFGENPESLNQFDKNGDNVIQLIILKGQPGHQDAEIRTEEVINYLESNGYQLEVLEIIEAYFDKDIAEEEMGNAIIEYGDTIEIVISNNDAMAIGAIDALTYANYFDDLNFDGVIDHETEPWVPVVGIDGIPAAVQYIESGHLYGTVINDSSMMAQAINELANALINNLDLSDLSFSVQDGHYIWIDYQKFTQN